MRPVFFSVLLLALAACSPAPTPTAAEDGIEIREAYVAPSPAGVDLAAGYLTIVNHGPEDRLIGASSERAANVQLHTMQMDGPVMRMRMVESMTIPEGGEITLSPGGDHLMFTGLTAPFAAGDEVPVRLNFEHAGAIDVTLLVGGGPH
ncbi:MAG: copper chaperone PCu(A)C [Hyphomonadaceae bacterium]|nr:copper chaperone PCu(A)C [Hyphomonadaceae bacterium]